MEGMRQLGALAYTAVDPLESSCKQHKKGNERSSKKVESVGAETGAHIVAKINQEDLLQLLRAQKKTRSIVQQTEENWKIEHLGMYRK